MDYWKKYQELLTRINIQEEIVSSLRSQSYGLRIQTNNTSTGNGVISDMPRSKMVNPDLEVVFSKLLNVNRDLEVEKEVLDELLKNKNNIETYIAELDGVEHKVAYLKIIAGKDNDYITRTLGLSKGYVKNILTKIEM